MSSAGIEPVIPAIERSQTYALDRAVTRTGGTEILPLVYLNAGIDVG